MNNISSTISEYTARIFNEPVTLIEKACSFISNNRYLLLGAVVLGGGGILYFRSSVVSQSQIQQPEENLEQTASEAAKLAKKYTSDYGVEAPNQLKNELNAPTQKTPQKQRTAMVGAYCLVMNSQKDTSRQYETSDEFRHDLNSK